MERIYNIVVTLLTFSSIFALTNIETDWEYFQSTSQTFYMFENIYIDNDAPASEGNDGDVWFEY